MSEQSNMMNRESRGFFWLLVCFTCSGMSALIYEVAWVRSLELIFGATTFAVATVLAAFMGGLAFGSYVMGRLAQRLARFHPLKIYAVMECGIGVIALLIPFLFEVLAPIYRAVWQQFHASFAAFSALRFVLCVLILLIPTSLMGATLPIMSNFVNRNVVAGIGQQRIGLLYTVNTAGAVLGTLAAGFLLFPIVGLHKTQLIAVALSSTAALGAFLISRMTAWERPLAADAPATTNPSPDAVAPARSVAWLLVLLYAVSGFTAMVYEVAWSRVLVLVLGSSTYAYTIMLATFLFGLATGAWLATRYLIRSTHPLWTAGLCQLFVALTTFAGLFLVEELPYLYLKLFESLHPGAMGMMAILFLLSFGLMILPTLGLGAMFPVTIHGLCPSGEKTARIVGWAYSLNTIGAILGSVAGGFWLLPAVGMQYTILCGIGLNTLMAALGFVTISVGRLARYRLVIAGLLGLFIASLFVNTIPWEPHIMSSGIFRYVRSYENLSRAEFHEKVRQARGQILFFKEGLTCTVTIFRTVTSLCLLVNGKPDASTPTGMPQTEFARQSESLADLPTQILLGQVPLLLAPKNERVMVIGLGSGVTVGSILRHPVKELECVELEDVVVQGSKLFNQYNGRPFEDPRVRLVVNDARNHLLVTDQKFDVIISEPSNPWIPGAANLFTREFFELAKTRMQPGGIFCQWIQLYELHVADFQTILRSFQGVFPHLRIFRTGQDAIVLGTVQPLKLDYAQLQARLTPAIRDDLKQIRLAGVDDFLASYWTGGEQLRQAILPGNINTDDNMYIEFKAPMRVLISDPGNNRRLQEMFAQKSTGLVPDLGLGSLSAPEQAAVWAGLADAALRQKWLDRAVDYARYSLLLARNPLAARVFGAALAITQQQQAAEWWTQTEREFPDSPEILRALAEFQQQATNWVAARRMAERLLQKQPDDIPGRYLLGKSLYHLREWPDAAAAFGPHLKQYGENTNLVDLPWLVGATQWQLGQYAEAVAPLRKALEWDYWNLEARRLLADALTRLARREEAELEWQRLGQLRTSQAQNRLMEARQAFQRSQPELARMKLEEAHKLDPWDETTNFELARARSRAGDVKAAVALVENYLRWDRDRGWAVGYLSQLYAKAGDQQQADLMAARFHSLTGKAWVKLEE